MMYVDNIVKNNSKTIQQMNNSYISSLEENITKTFSNLENLINGLFSEKFFNNDYPKNSEENKDDTSKRKFHQHLFFIDGFNVKKDINGFFKGTLILKVPGFDPSTLNVEYEDGYLYIQGENEVIDGHIISLNEKLGPFVTQPEISLKNGLMIINTNNHNAERKKVDIK